MKAPMIDNPFGGRSVPEWRGKTPDTKVPDRIRDRVFARAKGICHLSGAKIQAGQRWDVEHIRPLALGGEHRETNMAPALVEPHREKTAEEKTAISKADRIRRKANGTWPKSKTPLRSRGFPPTREASR